MIEKYELSAFDTGSVSGESTAGDLLEGLRSAAQALRSVNMYRCAETVEQAIDRLAPRPPRRRFLVCVRSLKVMIASGMTRQEIAAALNTNKQNVCRWCKKFDLDLPRRQRPMTAKILPPSVPPRDWSEEEDDTLLALWERGNSISDIAIQMGNRTRNSVIGRVHRLNLPKRPSPIKRAA